MKIKRMLSAVIAAAAMFSAISLSVFAIGDNATYCFDTADKLSDWQLTDNADKAGLKISIDAKNAENGAGALAIYESFKGDAPNSSTGIYIDAKTLGLENFSGCTMQVSYKFDSDFDGSAENLSIFSDGIVWIQTAISRDNATIYKTASITVPENAANSRFGITVPTLIPATGTIVYIDNVIIFDKEGTPIENVGDYKMSDENTADKYKTTGTLTTVIYVVLLVVIVLLVAGGIFYVVRTLMKRFR